MRTLLLILSCIGVGYVIARVQHERRVSKMVNAMGNNEAVGITSQKEAIQAAIREAAAAKAGKIEVVNGADLDFGMMMKGTKRSHKFIFKNVGEANAKLWFKTSTCKCTVGKFKDATLAPGEETEVELEWKAEGGTGEFAQTATVGTDCPSQEEVKLTIHGEIGQAYVFDPPPHNHGDIFSNKETEIPFTIYSFQEGPMNLGTGAVKDAILSKRIKVELDSEKELTKGEIPKMESARRMIQGKIRVLPGVAAGPLNIDIHIVRKQKDGPDDEFLTYNVRGRVVTPVRIIAGDDYNETRNILSMGSAKSSNGLKKSFMIAIRNEDSKKDPNVRIGKVVPNQVKATLGEPKVSPNQRIYPITLEIPPGTDPVELDGTFSKDFGKIVIETDVESSPEIPIFLKFRITE